VPGYEEPFAFGMNMRKAALEGSHTG
jgi:hypothetical protein